MLGLDLEASRAVELNQGLCMLCGTGEVSLPGHRFENTLCRPDPSHGHPCPVSS